jgi:hypothetical protein
MDFSALAARLGLPVGGTKGRRARLAQLVLAGDATGVTRFIARDRSLFRPTRFGCRFEPFTHLRALPEITGIDWVRRSGFGAKAAEVEVGPFGARYRLLLSAGLPEAARAVSAVRLVTRIVHSHRLFEAFGRDAGGRGRFVLDVDDCADPGERVVGFSGPPDRTFLVPDQIFLATDGYADLRKAYAARARPLAEREDAIFWRGRSTGTLSPGETWTALPRVAFVAEARRIAAARPDLEIDVGLVSTDEGSGKAPWSELVARGLTADYVPIERFAEKRVHVDVDGNSNSWPGLFSKVLLGGPLLKVASRDGAAQWYYDRLVDGETLLFVRADLADLEARCEAVRDPAVQPRLAAGMTALAEDLTAAGEMPRVFPVLERAAAYWRDRL